MLSSWKILFAEVVEEEPESVREILTVTVDALVLHKIIWVTKTSPLDAVYTADSLACIGN